MDSHPEVIPGYPSLDSIEEGQELDDKVMDAVSQLLRDSHAHISGLNQPMAIAMPNLLRRENCDTEVGKQLLLVGCGNSMKLFNDHISFAYTHVFSAHAESCPTSAVGEPLGLYNHI